MDSQFSEEYKILLDKTLDLINRRQGFMQKLISNDQDCDKDTCRKNVLELDKLISEKKEELERLKADK